MDIVREVVAAPPSPVLYGLWFLSAIGIDGVGSCVESVSLSLMDIWQSAGHEKFSRRPP